MTNVDELFEQLHITFNEVTERTELYKHELIAFAKLYHEKVNESNIISTLPANNDPDVESLFMDTLLHENHKADKKLYGV